MSNGSPDPAPHDAANRRVFLTYGGLTELASRLGSPQVVLPWIYDLIGGPLYLFGLLTPSVRLGSMVSQMASVPILRSRSIHKWLTAGASVAISGLLGLLCFAVLELSTTAAIVVFFLCTLGFGLCNGVVQLTSQNVMAKSVSHGSIGRLIALQASIGGALTLIVTAVYTVLHPDQMSEQRHLLIIAAAGLFWTLAAVAITLVREPPQSVQSKRSLWSEVREGTKLYRTVTWFRRYTVTRLLFLSVGLATPFYSIHAASIYESATLSVSSFVFATGAANMVSGLVWGRLLGRDPRIVLVLVAVLAAAAGGLALTREDADDPRFPLVYAVVLAIVALAEQGLTQASKTYVATMAPNDERPLYLAANNMFLGMVAIGVSGVLGVVAHMSHIVWALCIIIALTLCAGASALFLVPYGRDHDQSSQ